MPFIYERVVFMLTVVITAVVCFLLDRISKIVMINNVFGITNLTENSYTESITVINGILNFNFFGNTGVAFGFMQDSKWFIVMLCTVMVLGILLIVYKTKPKKIAETLAYGMIIGGAVGNLTDRLMHGFVIDFIETKFIDFPVFNIADSFIVVGAILLCIYYLFFDKKEDEIGKD